MSITLRKIAERIVADIIVASFGLFRVLPMAAVPSLLRHTCPHPTGPS